MIEVNRSYVAICDNCDVRYFDEGSCYFYDKDELVELIQEAGWMVTRETKCLCPDCVSLFNNF